MSTFNFNLLAEPVRENSVNAVNVYVPNLGEIVIIKQIRIVNVTSTKYYANLFFAPSASAFSEANTVGWQIPIIPGIPYSERVYMPIQDTHKFGYQSSFANALVISLWGVVITN